MKNKKPEFKKFIVTVRVHDLDRAISFYKEVLGLSLVHKESDWASFEAMGAEIHLYLHGGTEYGTEFRVSDIKKEIETLKSRGVKFFTNTDQANLVRVTGDIMEFPWGKAAYFKDSEANEIALVED